MTDTKRNLERLRPLLERLTAAVSAGDAPEFERVLDDLVHGRRKDLFAELRRLTARVRQALESFQLNARFSELAEKDVPDARQRLIHVMKLTDDAAHQTMDLIERATPLVAILGRHGRGSHGRDGSRRLDPAAVTSVRCIPRAGVPGPHRPNRKRRHQARRRSRGHPREPDANCGRSDRHAHGYCARPQSMDMARWCRA